MILRCLRRIFGSLLVTVAAAAAAGCLDAAPAQAGTIPNWSAPAFWAPASTQGRTAHLLGKESDLTGALPFVPVTPCRIVDTRGPAGAYGGPSLAAGVPRSFALASGPCAGIPSSVAAYSLNLTVTNTQGAGDIRVYPQGAAEPLVSTLNYVAGQTIANAAVVPAGTGGGITVVADVHGTNLIIDINGYYDSTLNSGEQLIVHASIGGDGAIRGVNSAGIGVWGESSANDGVHGHTSAAGCCVSGVAGLADGANYGVYGASGTGEGMFGTSFLGIGVEGREGSGSGVVAPGHTAVFGDADTGYGVLGGSAQSDGVHGQSSANFRSGVAGVHTAAGNGVFGMSVAGTGVVGHSTSGPGLHGDSVSANGVEGQTGSGSAVGVSGFNSSSGAGVFGLSVSGNGVVGSSTSGAGVSGTSNSSTGLGVVGSGGDGVLGVCITSAGTGVSGLTGENTYPARPVLAGVVALAHNGVGAFGGSLGGDGVQGYTDSGTNSGVYGQNAAGGKGVFGVSGTGNGVEGGSTSGYGVKGTSASSFGVFAQGGFAGVGAKYFVEPHPTDPTKEIRYACLEGNEVGTYFRGTGHLVQGRATIAVPDDFRMVTDADGLTVQLTPIGKAANLYCVARSLDRIDVAGSEDIDFDYQVNGVRKAFVGFQPIHENVVFVPHSMDARALTVGLPDESVRRLIANGILNEDGSINQETANRLGWDQRPGWDRVPPTPAAETKPAPASN